MPRVKVLMISGAEHEVRQMPAPDAMDLVEDFQAGEGPVLSLLYGELGNNDMLHLARRNIEAILVEGD